MYFASFGNIYLPRHDFSFFHFLRQPSESDISGYFEICFRIWKICKNQVALYFKKFHISSHINPDIPGLKIRFIGILYASIWVFSSVFLNRNTLENKSLTKNIRWFSFMRPQPAQRPPSHGRLGIIDGDWCCWTYKVLIIYRPGAVLQSA